MKIKNKIDRKNEIITDSTTDLIGIYLCPSFVIGGLINSKIK